MFPGFGLPLCGGFDVSADIQFTNTNPIESRENARPSGFAPPPIESVYIFPCVALCSPSWRGLGACTCPSTTQAPFTTSRSHSSLTLRPTHQVHTVTRFLSAVYLILASKPRTILWRMPTQHLPRRWRIRMPNPKKGAVPKAGSFFHSSLAALLTLTRSLPGQAR